jgi:DNA-binding NarL/FixJ family response regulator
VIRSVHAGPLALPSTWGMGDHDLATRELEVLGLIRDGYRNKQLSISQTTVNFHINKLVDKRQTNNRAHAVIIALRPGLLQI